MYFKKISIHGFKSFADPITIEFDRGITCVVGPNGSGKSNIFDALRWVLGEQSPKTLRGGKMDEVIFAGTASRKSRGMAEVSLLIDNSDAGLPVDFSEVEITRRMYRSGESEYYINHSRCRLRDIRELVMDTGIAVDGYSFIGQGKIAEIVSGRPESRREIFEEAAGIVRYRNRKAEAEKKLEDTGRNLDRVNDIIAGLEERLLPLKAEAERAELYLRLSREYAEAETEFIGKTISGAEEICESLKQQISDTRQQIGEVRRKREEAAAEAERLAEQTAGLDREDMEERDRMMAFASRLSELRNDRKYTGQRISSLQEQIESLNRECEALACGLREEKENLRISEQRSGEIRAELAGISRLLESKNAAFIADSGLLRESEKQAEKGRDRLYEIGTEISSVTAESAAMKKLRDSLSERCLRLKEGDSENPSEEIASSEEEDNGFFRKEALLREAEKAAEQSRAEQRERTERLAQLTRELQTAVMALSRKEAERNVLLHMENTYEGYSGAVRCVMNEPGLGGIFGTVGELIEVPEGYEIAVETALGARMQNIVCRDDASADRAVRLLKQKKAGRLTFLPLSSLRVSKRSPDPRLSQEEGFLAEAVRCVTIRPAYEIAVEYLLSGVIIVDSLKNASRIAARYRGYRCVTLEGELVSTGGAITGGSYKKSGGGILDRKKRISDVESAIRADSLERDRLERLAEDLRDQISEAEARQKDAKREAERLKIELIREKEETASRGRIRQEMLARRRRMRQETERLEAEIEKTDRRISELGSEEVRLKGEMERLSRDVGQLLEDNEQKRKQLEKSGGDITELKLRAESLRGSLSAEEATAGRMRKEELRLQDEISDKEKIRKQSKEELRERQEEAENIQALLTSMESSERDGSGRLEEIRRKKEESMRLAAEQNARREKNERTLYKLEAGCREMEARLGRKEEQIRRLKDRLWDEFEMTYPEISGRFRPSFSSAEEAARRSGELKRRLKEMGGVNTGAAAEYEEVRSRYEFLAGQRSDLTEAVESLGKIIRETDRKIRSDFQKTFRQIQSHFKDVFSELFGGGTAKLILTGDDPLSAEIGITAQPPGKKLQNMNLLSGGEKTMTAVALMFAVLKAKPAPFCILDEVEAALDEANIERFSAYLENFKGVQFVLVTHQKVTMEHADALYGVTMPEKGISQVLSLSLRDTKRIAEEMT